MGRLTWTACDRGAKDRRCSFECECGGWREAGSLASFYLGFRISKAAWESEINLANAHQNIRFLGWYCAPVPRERVGGFYCNQMDGKCTKRSCTAVSEGRASPLYVELWLLAGAPDCQTPMCIHHSRTLAMEIRSRRDPPCQRVR